MTLLVLLERGYRPALAAIIAAATRRQRFRRAGGQWRNWGRTAACQPRVMFFPETLADLVEIVTEARVTGRRLRVAASGHSWPALVATNDLLVVSHGLNRVSVDLTDPARPLLVAEAGADPRGDQRGAGGPWPDPAVQRGAGERADRRAGGDRQPRLGVGHADLVERIEVVQASGELVCYSTATHGPAVLNAVRLSLGVFGIIYRLHLRVQHSDARVPVATMLRDIATLVPQHENLDLYYWPYQDTVTIRVWDRTTAARTVATRKTWTRRWGIRRSCRSTRRSSGPCGPGRGRRPRSAALITAGYPLRPGHRGGGGDPLAERD